MTGTSKKPRRPYRVNTGKAAIKTPIKAEAAAKPVEAKTKVPAPAPVAVKAAIPDVVAVAEPAPAPELTAADLAPAEDIKTEEPTEHTETFIQTLPEVEAATVEVMEEPAIETVEWVEQKGTEIMTDVIESTKKFAEEAKTRFESAFTEISEKAKVGVEKSSKAFEELNDLAKGNVEALVESGKIATKGVETLGQDAAEYGRVTFEKASAALKSLAAVKSPAEFFQLQSELLSSSFDAFAKETAKNSEAFLKLAGDVAQPISTRVSIVTEKVRSIAA